MERPPLCCSDLSSHEMLQEKSISGQIKFLSYQLADQRKEIRCTDSHEGINDKLNTAWCELKLIKLVGRAI